MDLQQIRCFIAVADCLHFGRAAQKLDMLPASLGRHIKLLEAHLGTRLLSRTTRNVILTEAGERFLEGARDLIQRADRLETAFREQARRKASVLRVSAIDSAAVGLMPQIIPLFRRQYPNTEIVLIEEKTIRSLPGLVSGRIDLAFVRPPEQVDTRLEFRELFRETAVVAVPEGHALARLDALRVKDMQDAALIVPDRRSRPHSHDLSIKLFLEAGLSARIIQIAEEKQTIVNLVASGIGLAILPRWISRLNVDGVRFIPLEAPGVEARKKLVLAAAWLRDTRDPLRESFLDLIEARLEELQASA
ncbi:LysR family transcriptional regulator (plasmid) [Peteryoungia desertarenae]|uniref:LysR family transcriptional regulator n=1 Tax=Peteryoungia desertarenae TaxID=1813451 RepID=A0ABX6QTU3_9HYPH|nr:LysR substrate-binding domain-containing protein [Peteryoungia desertarenae]QLF71919.1 LysR family transcriptional regulator [Peteryoungia desertarenae]